MVRGILRAAFEAVQNFDLTQGASTITQQIIKNNVFDDWVNEETMQKIKRKISYELCQLIAFGVVDHRGKSLRQNCCRIHIRR